MIKNWIITGDTHGGMSTVTRLSNIHRNMPECKPEETGVIILGDAGLNYYLNNTDKKYKKMLNNMGFTLYCVRGNHEERPENVPGIYLIEDENVHGIIFQETDYPNIRYFKDCGEYNISGHSVLTIGGAYSIDKWYRLARAGYSAAEAEIANPKKCGWFKDELLTAEEMEAIGNKVANKQYDFVFTHTCPLSWEPTDLFLGGIDQSTVDKSMEIWMDELKDHIDWGIWCFGHFHADRIERPHVEQFYFEYETIESIMERWNNYDAAKTLDWWLPMSPAMKEIINA